jgi:hypothetical protein
VLGDLQSKKLIVLKGLLFLLCILLCGGLLIARSPDWRTVLAVALLSWCSARFYYFLFYVLHQYVDPTLKYDGLLPMLRAILASRRNP